jgi:LmbE family N-acetylglucosaminyl deacetylase
MSSLSTKKVALIVAHPDDETLWAGGTILSHPSWQWFIVCLCRGSDTGRATKFKEALKILKSEGIMGDLDEGSDQNPLDNREVEHAIIELLPPMYLDLIISHNPDGEYSRHIRHEEVGKGVIKLWHAGRIYANELWTFAYEDGHNENSPRPVKTAAIYRVLTKRIWLRKYSIITDTYGFEKGSFEAESTPRAESFRQFTNSYDVKKMLNSQNVLE